MVTDQVRSSYDVVLQDMQTERTEIHKQVATLQRKLRELDQTILGIQHRLGIAEVFSPISVSTTVNSNGSKQQRYAGASTRWGILLELNSSTASLSVQEIADALLAGGISTKATNFNNNVSAVLSDMKSNKGEVDVADGKWFLTDVGKSAAAYIWGKLRKIQSRREI